jgi:hypothetical protein
LDGEDRLAADENEVRRRQRFSDGDRAGRERVVLVQDRPAERVLIRPKKRRSSAAVRASRRSGTA